MHVSRQAGKGALFWEWTVRKQGEGIDVSLPNGLHPYGVSLWDETFTCAASTHVLLKAAVLHPVGVKVRGVCARFGA